MTSTALLLLSLALAWSIAGTALEPNFDHGSSSVMTSLLKNHEVKHNNNQKIKTQGTKDSYRHFKIVNNEAANSNKEDFRQAKHKKSYIATKEQIYNLKLHKAHEESRRGIQMSNSKNPVGLKTKGSMRRHNFRKPKHSVRRFKRQDDDKMKCESFNAKLSKQLSHPGNGSGLYYSDANCITVIEAQEGKTIQLTFVDQFNIEEHPDCAYDYLEIRDGKYGFSRFLGKYCGSSFPNQIRSTGPYLWIKFFSDDTIEYEGFHINIEYLENAASHSIPDECYIERKGLFGYINTNITEYADCKTKTGILNQPLDVLWKITTPSKDTYKIYLNFTSYLLGKTNECDENVIEVYGSILEYSKKLARYCGSVANPVLTRKSENGEDKGDIMYVRFYASRTALSSSFNATYTVFRQLPSKSSANVGESDKHYKCSEETEFDCEDSTCIAGIYKCDGYAQCRLKTDEVPDNCKKEAQSVLTEPEIRTILIILSLILSGMIFVFLFKCFWKLYMDQMAIKEHIRQACEDRLDSLVSSQLMLDPKRLQIDSGPRASLERENHTNEMFKKQRNISQNRPISIDSDYVPETHPDLEDEPWRGNVDNVPVKAEEIKIELNGKRSRRESKKEPSRKESKSIKEVSEEDSKSQKEIRDVSAGMPDSKESGCQTRESLFQEVSSPEGTQSGSGSRGFSAATIVRPSSPAPPTQTSQLTVELLKTKPSRQESQTKKIPDRRPMSTETTRSAPDVIIVSKPVR